MLQVEQDGSCLVLQQKGRFVLHYRQGERHPSTYAVDALPERVWHSNGHDRLTLGPIVRKAVLLW